MNVNVDDFLNVLPLSELSVSFVNITQCLFPTQRMSNFFFDTFLGNLPTECIQSKFPTSHFDSNGFRNAITNHLYLFMNRSFHKLSSLAAWRSFTDVADKWHKSGTSNRPNTTRSRSNGSDSMSILKNQLLLEIPLRNFEIMWSNWFVTFCWRVVHQH